MLLANFLDLGRNELRNALFQNLSTAPSSISTDRGRFYYDTTTSRLRVFDGTTWNDVGVGTVTSFSSGNLSPLFTTGVATASSTPALSFTLTNAAQNAVFAGPSSGGAGAPSYRSLVQADIPASIPLSYWGAATGNLSLGSFKITNSADGTANTDLVTVQQLNSAIAGQKKTSVKGATAAVLSITARTSTTLTVGGTSLVLDGVTYANGDTILVKDSTSGTGGTGTHDNGKYVVSGVGTSVVLTRSADMDASTEIDGQYVVVEDGTTLAGTIWLTVSEVTTIGTDPIVWTKVNQATDLVAGAGLLASGLTWDIVSANTGITVNTNDIALNLATNSGLEISSGLKIKSDTATANTIGLQLTSNGAGLLYNSASFTGTTTLALASTVAGNGLDLISGILSVKVDNTTIEITSDVLNVKAAGITQTHIASSALGTSLTGGSGTVLNVANYTPVSGTTVARKYAAAVTIPTGAYSVDVTHNLGTKDVQVYVYDSVTDDHFWTDVRQFSGTVCKLIGNNNTGASISARCVVVG